MIEHLNKEGVKRLITIIKTQYKNAVDNAEKSASSAAGNASASAAAALAAQAAASQNVADIKTLQEKNVYLTQAEYDALVAAGTVDMTKDYNIYEEET